MGSESRKNIIETLKSNRPLRFLLVFVVALAIGLGVVPIGETIGSVYLAAIKSGLASFNKTNAGRRHINTIQDKNSPAVAEFEIQFTDRRSAAGEIPARVVQTDFRREAYLPFALLIALFVGMPVAFRKKYKKILLGSLAVNIYILIKLFAFIFDNYNYPDMAATELSGLVSWAVYAANAFANTTGFSTTVVVPIVIWVALCYGEITEIASSDLKIMAKRNIEK